MERKHNPALLRTVLWGAALLALIAAALAFLRPAQPASYADAVYVAAREAIR